MIVGRKKKCELEPIREEDNKIVLIQEIKPDLVSSKPMIEEIPYKKKPRLVIKRRKIVKKALKRLSVQRSQHQKSEASLKGPINSKPLPKNKDVSSLNF